MGVYLVRTSQKAHKDEKQHKVTKFMIVWQEKRGSKREKDGNHSQGRVPSIFIHLKENKAF